MSALNTQFLTDNIQNIHFTLLISIVSAICMIWQPLITTAIIFGTLIIFAWYRFCFHKADLSFAETLFFVFVAGTFAFSKNFSVLHLQIMDLPLFISEAMLFILLGFLVLPRYISQSAMSWRHPLFYLLLAYFFLGLFNLIRGVPSYGLFALRDAAVVYYAAFYLITIEVFGQFEKIFVLFRMLCVSAVVLLILGILFCLPINLSSTYLQYTKNININFLYGLVLIFLFAFYTMMGSKRKWASLFFLAILFMVVYMQARTTWVSLTIAFFFLAIMMRRRLLQIMPRNILIFVIIFPILLGMGYLVNKEKILSLGIEITSIFRTDMDHRSAANVRWRLMLWEQAALRGIKENPLIGAGYGADYHFMINGRYIADIKGAGASSGIVPPHNGYVALFFKMGILGLGVFVLINAVFFFSCMRYYMRCDDEFRKKFLLAVMASQIHICVGAFFFEAIEIPQVGIFLWILMGLGVSVMQNNGEHKSEQ